MRYITVIEKIAIFIYVIVLSSSNRNIQERY